MSWTKETYFAKAHSYWSRGTNRERGSEEHLFSVAMSVEFTIRGALCHFHPSLNAASDEESLLFAFGLTPNRPERSVELSTAFGRLIRLVPEVTESEQVAIRALIEVRNRELHSDEAAFASMNWDSVIPKILSFLVRISDAIGGDLEQLLTSSDAAQARETFKALSKDRKERVRGLIKTQKDGFFSKSDNDIALLRKEHTPKFTSAVMSKGHHVKSWKCPSCAGLGILGGNPVGRSSALLDDEGIYSEIRIVPSVFSCKICDLQINGLDELIAAGMPYEFISRDYIDAVEHFGIDVMDYVDPDEIIREYHYQNAFMDE